MEPEQPQNIAQNQPQNIALNQPQNIALNQPLNIALNQPLVDMNVEANNLLGKRRQGPTINIKKQDVAIGKEVNVKMENAKIAASLNRRTKKNTYFSSNPQMSTSLDMNYKLLEAAKELPDKSFAARYGKDARVLRVWGTTDRKEILKKQKAQIPQIQSLRGALHTGKSKYIIAVKIPRLLHLSNNELWMLNWVKSEIQKKYPEVNKNILKYLAVSKVNFFGKGEGIRLWEKTIYSHDPNVYANFAISADNNWAGIETALKDLPDKSAFFIGEDLYDVFQNTKGDMFIIKEGYKPTSVFNDVVTKKSGSSTTWAYNQAPDSWTERKKRKNQSGIDITITPSTLIQTDADINGASDVFVDIYITIPNKVLYDAFFLNPAKTGIPLVNDNILTMETFNNLQLLVEAYGLKIDSTFMNTFYPLVGICRKIEKAINSIIGKIEFLLDRERRLFPKSVFEKIYEVFVTFHLLLTDQGSIIADNSRKLFNFLATNSLSQTALARGLAFMSDAQNLQDFSNFLAICIEAFGATGRPIVPEYVLKATTTIFQFFAQNLNVLPDKNELEEFIGLFQEGRKKYDKMIEDDHQTERLKIRIGSIIRLDALLKWYAKDTFLWKNNVIFYDKPIVMETMEAKSKRLVMRGAAIYIWNEIQKYMEDVLYVFDAKLEMLAKSKTMRITVPGVSLDVIYYGFMLKNVALINSNPDTELLKPLFNTTQIAVKKLVDFNASVNGAMPLIASDEIGKKFEEQYGAEIPTNTCTGAMLALSSLPTIYDNEINTKVEKILHTVIAAVANKSDVVNVAQ